jgi:cold shock CspA family protein
MSETPTTAQGHNSQLTGRCELEPARSTAAPVAPPESDLAVLLALLQKMRFAGPLVRKVDTFGFIRLDGTTLDIFLHRDICDEIVPFDSLRVGDRLRFQIKRSKRYPGKLCASRVTREEKI